MGASTHKNLYEAHFGLLESPFDPTPNPSFSYSHQLYREAFAMLRYGITTRKGFLVITGDPGTGKTTLLRTFMQSAEPTVHTAFIFNPKLSFSQLVRSILVDLGISSPEQDRFALLAKLNDYLIEQFTKDHIVVVLIDEAQELNEGILEELKLLSNLETDSSRLLQIVLAGQTVLERKLNQPALRQLKQRIALRCRLTPLPSDQVNAYINYRLEKAGYEGKELFEKKAIDQIGRYSRGIPRLINVICDNALLIAYAASKRRVSAGMIEEVSRDLSLTKPSSPRHGPIVDFSKVPSREEQTRDPLEEIPFADGFFIAYPPPELYPKRKVKREITGMLFALVLTVVAGVALYSQRNQHWVSPLVAGVEVFAQQSDNNISDLAVRVEQQGKEYLSGGIKGLKDYFDLKITALSELVTATGAQIPAIRDSVSATISKVESRLPDTQAYISKMPANLKDWSKQVWESLLGSTVKPAGSVVTSEESPDGVTIPEQILRADPNIDPNDTQDQTANDRPAPASKEAGSNQPVANDTSATGWDSRQIVEPQNPKEKDEMETTRATTQHEPQTVSPESERLRPDSQAIAKKNEQHVLGNFEVVRNSFLRDQPGSDAAITILSPGTRLRVEAQQGVYLLVRSLDDRRLRGYVHLEDAFFERIR
jgi:general secretion pathway protein A